MPHKNALIKLQSYGHMALDLDALDDALDEAGYGEKREQLLIRLVAFLAAPEAQSVVARLAVDHYAFNRELAASIMNYLWVYWKTLSDDKQIKAHCASLKWTIPLLEQLIQDKAAAPATLAIFAVREMDYAALPTRKLFRRLMKQALTHRLASVRLEAVRNIEYMYDFATDGHAVDDECLTLLVQSTYDTAEAVRDWACFTLWFNIQNRTTAVEAALWDAYRREDPDSDAYLEAVIGLASYGNEGEITATILANLKRDDCGPGWIDAVQATNSMECWAELRNTYDRLKSITVEGSDRVRRIQEALDDPEAIRLYYRPISAHI